MSGADSASSGAVTPEGAGLALREAILASVRTVDDYPVPGVAFKDITPLLADHAAFVHVIEGFVAPWRDQGIDLVAGIEARGFILAAPVALALGAGFIPVRKAGKLPYETVSRSYALEYGIAEIELHRDAVRPGQRVLLVDDVLATGGTAEAAGELIESLGGEVMEIAVLLELGFLNGRQRLANRRVRSLALV